MKRIRGLAGVMVLCAVGFVAAPASAATILLNSDGTAADPNESNSSGNPTIVIPPHPDWFTPPGTQWVSHLHTGDSADPLFTVVPNGTIVTFAESFFVSAPSSGFITVLADDSTSVILDGVEIFPEAPPNSYTVCSDLPIGCLEVTQQIIALNLAAGNHLLQFAVQQHAEVAFGLNYSGSVTELPEPTSRVLLGTGLIGLAARARKRFSGRA
jgi:hypothetical protein